MENYTVYKHTFPNGKVYIGITKRAPEKLKLANLAFKPLVAENKRQQAVSFGNIKNNLRR